MKKVLFDLSSKNYCAEDLIAALNIVKAGKDFGSIEEIVDAYYAFSVLQDYVYVLRDLSLEVLDLCEGHIDVSL